ncbi:glutamate--tRNA ligase [Acetobacteraceae bacterium]|nr:glutamate--tRNA ligase [Acetobacteraceae bacterium]
MTIRTRFAPSPTGLLHIGNARAALFNYLFSRHHGGEFFLRIEDTDKERSTQEAVDVIFRGLKWMGLDYDNKGEVRFQASYQPRHAEIAKQLLAEGKAYRCYATQEELEQMREEARAAGKPPRYNGLWRDRNPSEAPEGQPFTVRLKAPKEGKQVLNDLIQGTVEVANAEMDDLILLRSDGTPTYLLAVVVDDHDMEITHVMRGDDHLTNTFRQMLIYQAMGWDCPKFAHLPLIHGPDGGKLSKRHGAQSVIEFREQGILPEALCNYLLRLGWGHGDEEILTRQEQIKLFDLDGVGKSPSRMDYAKLNHLNGVWLRKATDERLIKEILSRLKDEISEEALPVFQKRLEILMPSLKERAANLVELADNARFALPGPIPAFNDKALKILSNEGIAVAQKTANMLEKLEDFSAEPIHTALKEFAETENLKLGKVAQPLRASVTGTTASPGIDVTLAALGKEEVIRRIRATKNLIKSEGAA